MVNNLNPIIVIKLFTNVYSIGTTCMSSEAEETGRPCGRPGMPAPGGMPAAAARAGGRPPMEPGRPAPAA